MRHLIVALLLLAPLGLSSAFGADATNVIPLSRALGIDRAAFAADAAPSLELFER